MKKVFVAMSGGVDSSVAAALLKKQNYEVTGVFMKLTALPSFQEAEKRARKIAKILKIPFLTWDFRKEFKKKVINYFLAEYQKGRTPNPCVICNQEIKFGLFLEKCLKLKTDFMATGHYVRKLKIKNWKLKIARDRTKDQSYFLWRLNQKKLERVLFPVGNYTKTQVRNLARKFKLPVLNVPESQEICFIAKRVNDFLKQHLKPRPGKIITTKGKVIGQHPGIFYFTIGQRRGLEISGNKPYYVAAKDVKNNILIVAEGQDNSALFKKEIELEKMNYANKKMWVLVRVRYRQPLVKAILQQNKLIFEKPVEFVTPGQSAVFYAKNGELLGGGIIK